VKTLIAVMMALLGTLAMGQSAAVKTWDPNSHPFGEKTSVPTKRTSRQQSIK
jgi:hypothetical protein